MKNTSTSIIIFLFLLIIISCTQKKESQIKFKDFEINVSKDEEPPLVFELVSKNGTQYFIENQPKKWNGVPQDSEIKIKVYDWKLFPHNNIEFEYPRTYSFEADLSKTNDIWTLSGNDFKIMVIRPLIEMDVKTYVDKMVEQFGPSNCTTKEIFKKLNHSELNGIQLLVKLSGVYLELNVMEIIDNSGNKSLLVFQDSLSDAKKNSKESSSTMKRIEQTFKVN
ncbi:hypothetical protein [Aquimarina algicola]|uniref:Lipoprotein n=1 Tax=Aquimarina algicola TaxID=2589995 RepID=A0A504JBE2_9FLAO|nr:hypothetical protein [Aquimarina algicola]TPN85865.1 hypothetical protein FHK87_11310 [Aquimarina algicola]